MNVALPDTPLLLFRIIVGVLILAFFVYLSSTIICRKRFSMACYGWSILSHFCVICFNCFVIGRDSPYILIIAFLSTFFVVWLSVRAVNLALIRDGFVLCGLYILGDAVSADVVGILAQFVEVIGCLLRALRIEFLKLLYHLSRARHQAVHQFRIEQIAVNDAVVFEKTALSCIIKQFI